MNNDLPRQVRDTQPESEEKEGRAVFSLSLCYLSRGTGPRGCSPSRRHRSLLPPKFKTCKRRKTERRFFGLCVRASLCCGFVPSLSWQTLVSFHPKRCAGRLGKRGRGCDRIACSHPVVCCRCAGCTARTTVETASFRGVMSKHTTICQDRLRTNQHTHAKTEKRKERALFVFWGTCDSR
jgi:hypothetical protein